MPLDPDAAAFLERLRSLGVPAYSDLPVAEGRRLLDEGTRTLFGEPDPVHAVEDADADGVPVRVYRPADGDLPALLYLHGGGWVIGSLDSHDLLCRTLAARSGCGVVSVGYRLAPEHPHPAAVEDAWAATTWAAARFAPLAVGGDSAGGHLAAVLARRARDRGVALALQVLLYPVTDHGCDTPSFHARGTGTNLTAETMRWFWAQYLPDASLADDPEVSPLRAPDLEGLAPALVITAEYDPLCDEGEAYARRLREAGVPVTLSRYEGQIHGFLRMPAQLPRGWDGIDEVAAAVRSALGSAGAPHANRTTVRPPV